MMRMVIHDWDDDQAIIILKTCRRAMRETARLVLIERIIAPPMKRPRQNSAISTCWLCRVEGSERAKSSLTCLPGPASAPLALRQRVDLTLLTLGHVEQAPPVSWNVRNQS